VTSGGTLRGKFDRGGFQISKPPQLDEMPDLFFENTPLENEDMFQKPQTEKIGAIGLQIITTAKI